jgi:hypothetical protein
MKKNIENNRLPDPQDDTENSDNLQGYPKYPDGDDIYKKYLKDSSDPDAGIINVVSNGKYSVRTGKEKGFIEDFPGSDLDIPGSELDDYQELDGNEDEENNYYSLGGDDHNDLDEDKID